jgi:hypothetical protein
MPTTQSRLATHAPLEPRLKQGAPLTKTAKPRTKAQQRANKRLLEDRQTWDIEKIIAEQEAVASKKKQVTKDLGGTSYSSHWTSMRLGLGPCWTRLWRHSAWARQAQ